jgi:hypothetical protein
MKRIVSCGVVVWALAGVAGSAGAQGAAGEEGAICTQLFGGPKGVRGVSGAALPARTRGVFDVCYDGDQWHVQLPPNARLTNRDAVWVRVRHFNFLRYALSFDITEERAESYGYLASLWSSALDLNMGSLLGALDAERADARLVTASREVYRAAQAVQRKVDAALAPHKSPGLSPEEARALDASTADVQAALTTLHEANATLQQLVEADDASFKTAFSSRSSTLYALATNAHSAATTKADAFLTLARRSLGDEIKKVGTKDAGTRVTVVMTATDPSGAKSEVETVHYFVQSVMPLVAHGGVVVSGLKDVSFEKVKRAAQFSEEDYFQQQSGNNQLTAFSTFLGWQLFASRSSLDTETKQQKVGVLMSLGTDLSSPGRHVYVGPSVMLLGRLVVTGGAALGTESTGSGQIEPNVFRLVRQTRSATWFSSIGVRVH